MTWSLKDQNKIPLLLIALANLTLFVLLVNGDPVQIGNWANATETLRNAVPAGIGLVFIGVLNAQLSSEMKARIVFLKWRHPLPGSEAFSRYAKQDDRIDRGSLEKRFGPLPTAPKEQSALWYKLYKSVGNEPAVSQVHREFLFARDYACLALLLLAVLGPIGFVQITVLKTALVYCALLVAQFVLATRAARNHGRRFVTTVLALKAAEP